MDESVGLVVAERGSAATWREGGERLEASQVNPRNGDHWTSGRYTSTSPGPDGPVTATGRYLTVWTLTPEGWRVAVDTGVPDPAAD